jgi:hypothetical protein
MATGKLKSSPTLPDTKELAEGDVYRTVSGTLLLLMKVKGVWHNYILSEGAMGGIAGVGLVSWLKDDCKYQFNLSEMVRDIQRG